MIASLLSYQRFSPVLVRYTGTIQSVVLLLYCCISRSAGIDSTEQHVVSTVIFWCAVDFLFPSLLLSPKTPFSAGETLWLDYFTYFGGHFGVDNSLAGSSEYKKHPWNHELQGSVLRERCDYAWWFLVKRLEGDFSVSKKVPHPGCCCVLQTLGVPLLLGQLVLLAGAH